MNKRKFATTAVASFGAAMASMYAAPELQGDIVDLNFSGSVPFDAPPFLHEIQISEVGASFSQWNDDIGKTLMAGELNSVARVSSGSMLCSVFVGDASIGPDWGFSNSATDTAFVGFRFGQNVGWFSLNLGGAGGAITFLDGEYGNAGECVRVGGTTDIIPGDVNGDGEVSLQDVAPFVALITSGEFQPEGDINGDGVVNLLDVEPFVDLLTGG